MKRLSHFFLAVFYLGISLGVSVHLHWCHGDLKDVSFYADDFECCCERFMPTVGCCDEDHIEISIEDEQRPSRAIEVKELAPEPMVPPPAAEFDIALDDSDAVEIEVPPDPGGPPGNDEPLYLLYNSLMYYG